MRKQDQQSIPFPMVICSISWLLLVQSIYILMVCAWIAHTYAASFRRRASSTLRSQLVWEMNINSMIVTLPPVSGCWSERS